MRLITIPMSHYCEKARWGLDWSGRDYVEEAHLQVFHYHAVRRLNAGSLVPVLVDGAQVVADSTAILQHLDGDLPEDRKLYPEALRPQIEALEEHFDEGLGVESRRWVYFRWLKVPVREVLRTAAQRTPGWQRAMAPFIFPLFRRFLTRHLAISQATVQAGRATIDAAFEQAAERIAAGGPFLLGERFTAADLSFACMAAPVLLPSEYGIRLPTPQEAPPAARSDIQRYRAHPAGQFALRLFREWRRSAQPVWTANRDRPA